MLMGKKKEGTRLKLGSIAKAEKHKDAEKIQFVGVTAACVCVFLASAAIQISNDRRQLKRSAYHGEFTHGSLLVGGRVNNQEDAIVLTDEE